MKEIKKNYQERQKIVRSNISPFHYLSWKVKGKTTFLPTGYSEDISGNRLLGCLSLGPDRSMTRIFNHYPLGMYGTIIHPHPQHPPLRLTPPATSIYQWVASHNSFRLCYKCFRLKSKVFLLRTEEVYYVLVILRSLKLALLKISCAIR